MVQTRWTHINRNYSFLTEVEAILLDGHFVLEHGGALAQRRVLQLQRHRGHVAARAIEEAGGWQHDTLTEDTDLSYRAQLKGWKFVYLQDVECPAELPVEMTAFKTQQARWAKGLIQCAIKKILPQVLRSKVPLRVKIEAWYHLTANLSYPLMIVSLRAAAAGHDHPLLPGLVPDALHRPAAVPGVDVLDFQLLPGLAEGAVSREMAALPALSSLPDGAGHRPDASPTRKRCWKR